jgi:Putative phage holin Dp-1
MTNPMPPILPKKGFVMSEVNYANMKKLVQVFLPAVSTLYFTLGSVWGLPAVTQVIGTLAALATFIGVLLGIASKTYNSSDAKYGGVIVVHEKEDGGKLLSLEVNGDPLDIVNQKEVTFKVAPPTTP